MNLKRLKMSERKLYQRFKEKIKATEPNCWVYKIPDWVGGGKRPGDFFLVIKGIPFLLEFKGKNGRLDRYQAYQQLDFINAGGNALVYWESKETLDDFVEHILAKTKPPQSL
jgi:hypothetical protein